MSRVRSSVRLRLTLWYATALAAIVLLFAGGVYGLVRWNMKRQADQQLRESLTAVEKAYREGGDELEEIDEHGSVQFFRVLENGTSTYQSAAWRRNGSPGESGKQLQREDRVWNAPSGEPFIVRTLPLLDTPKPVVLSVAISQRLAHQSMRMLVTTLLVGLPIAILIAALAGYWLSGKMLAPIIAMSTKAREITAERLAQRLPVANPEDEFGRLATVFNELLARLQESFDGLKRFTSDASHELRTPLTAIRSVGEVALHDNLPHTEYREVIGSMLEEADRLTRLLDTLLTLTRADHDQASVVRENVDVAAIASDVGDLLRSLAEERRQKLTVDAPTPLHVDADPNLLRQALINLLHNAVKYTPPEGTIRVSTHLSPRDDVVLSVSDSGPGIAAEHQGRIFDRFYRVDKARARETGGVGLGLALAKWAVEANGGRIELESELGRGCTFHIVLGGQVALQRDLDSKEQTY